MGRPKVYLSGIIVLRAFLPDTMVVGRLVSIEFSAGLTSGDDTYGRAVLLP